MRPMGVRLTLENNLPVPTGEDGTPRDMVILATSPAHLWSGFAATPEMPPRQRPSETMPADIEYVAMRLFGDWSPANVAKLAAGNAVMGVFTRPGGGTTFTCGCTDWARGLRSRSEPRCGAHHGQCPGPARTSGSLNRGESICSPLVIPSG